MKSSNSQLAFAITVSFLSLCSGRAVAGPLDPPSGAISPTYKTLGEVEPRIAVNATNTPGDSDSVYKITQPGSYYLTGNVTGALGKNGIEIGSSNVTLDLGGFHVRGVPGSDTGVRVTVAADNVTVRNGTVSNWVIAGIDLALALTQRGTLIEDINASNNMGSGIEAVSARVMRCSASANGNFGFTLAGANTVESCIATGNEDDGFVVGDASIVRGCVATANTGAGIIAGEDCQINACTASYNLGEAGIQVGSAALVSECIVRENGDFGVVTNSRSVVRDCVFDRNTGAGAALRCTGLGNRIEGNQFSVELLAIEITFGRAFIVRNTFVNCTTAWTLAGTNTFGPLVNTTGQISTTNPFANFQY